MNNGSGVSNFSSVSNINQILNAHHFQQQPSFQQHSQVNQGDRVLDEIDKVLSKVQKTQNIPNKVLEKIINQKDEKSVIP